MNKNIQKQLFILVLATIAIVPQISAQKIIYSENFVNGATPTTQCTAWNTFRAKLLSTYVYRSITIKGTNNTTGITITDPTITLNIANAMRTRTAYTVTVGGLTWRVGISCQNTNGGCSSNTDVELTVNGGVCSCATGYSLRPNIGNLNWGGLNGATCGAASQKMEVIFVYLAAPVDATMQSIKPLSACTPTQDIDVTFLNSGTKHLDSVDVNWTFNGVAQTTYKFNKPYVIADTLSSFTPKTITLKAGHTFTPFVDYEIRVWTSNPNGMQDTVADDDTAIYNFTFYGEPAAPTGGSFSFCGIGEKPLNATPAASGDSVFWFTEKVGGANFGIGANTTSPFMYSTDTFYIASYRVPTADTSDNGLNGNIVGTTNNSDIEGGMINVTAGSSDIILTQLSFGVQTASLTNYSLYTKSDSFESFENNSMVWTLLDTGKKTPVANNLKEMIEIPVNMVILAGTTQAFYFMCNGNNSNVLRGNVGIEDEFVKTSSGPSVIYWFGSGGVIPTWTINHELIYHAPSCSNSSARVAIPVEILRLPIGASLVEGTPFNGTFTTGTLADPDIVSANDEIVYDLKNPTLFPNTDFGTTWTISDTTLETINGVEVNMGNMVTIGATGSSDATFSFTPDSTIMAFTDSTLRLSLNLQNISTGCDTVVMRYIFVAPRVDPGFSLPAALCQGDPISFINTSTISTGGVLYKWDFGDGSSSVAPNTAHTYAAPGTYTVKLTTTSTPYGYVTDTSAIIVIQETPKADFKRDNACMGNDVVLTNTTTYGGSGSVIYDWDFGDGSAHSSNTNETKSYASASSYEVTLTADVVGCISKKIKTVYQFAKPVVSFTTSINSVCNYTEIAFPNTSTISNGTMGGFWDYGTTMDYSNLKDGEMTYTSPGAYQVKLKMVSEFGCTDSLEKTVSVKEGSKADFSFENGCIENPTSFTFTGEAPAGQSPTIIWTFGTEGQDGGANPTHQWQSTGSKNVQVKVVMNNGCNDSITKVVKVSDQPDVDFDFSGMCASDAVAFQNNSTVGTGLMDFEWDFNDNSTSTDVSPTHQFAAGTYDVKLKANIAQGCSDSITKQIVISANPDCSFTIADEYVNGHRGFKYTPTDASLPHYRWTFGEGGTSSSTTPLYQYLNDGSYTVTLFARNASGCECEMTIPHSVKDVVSINDTELEGVDVYPNPTTGKLTIDLPTQGEAYTIEVLSIIGKVIFTQEVTNTTGNVEINIGDNAKGIYLIKITSDNKSKALKVNLLK